MFTRALFRNPGRCRQRVGIALRSKSYKFAPFENPMSAVRGRKPRSRQTWKSESPQVEIRLAISLAPIPHPPNPLPTRPTNATNSRAASNWLRENSSGRHRTTYTEMRRHQSRMAPLAQSQRHLTPKSRCHHKPASFDHGLASRMLDRNFTRIFSRFLQERPNTRNRTRRVVTTSTLRPGSRLAPRRLPIRSATVRSALDDCHMAIRRLGIGAWLFHERERLVRHVV